MTANPFWDRLEALAVMFAGGYDAIDQNLDDYASLFKKLPAGRRKFLRHDADLLVAGLSRLSSRLGGR